MTQLISKLKRYKKRGDIYFAVCNSCFWCASYISTNVLDTSYYVPEKCPSCLKGNIESLPKPQNEGYIWWDSNGKTPAP